MARWARKKEAAIEKGGLFIEKTDWLSSQARQMAWITWTAGI